MTSVLTRVSTKEDHAADVVSKMSITVLGVVAFVSGVWAFACLTAGVASGSLVSGFLSAIVG